MKKVFQSLYLSRKVWLLCAAVVIGTLAYALTANALLVAALMLPFLVNMLGISIEDSSMNISGGTFSLRDMVGRDSTVQGDSGKVVVATTVTTIPSVDNTEKKRKGIENDG